MFFGESGSTCVSDDYRASYSAWVAVDVEFFSSALDFWWMISKIYLRTYLALPTVFPQLFGQGHGILRIASDYAIDNYLPASRAEFLVGLFDGYDSHSTKLVHHLMGIDSDADATGKGQILDQSAVRAFGRLVRAESSVVGRVKIPGLQIRLASAKG